MKTNLQKNWWVVAINGILAILFGVLILYDSETVMVSISMYFGLLILIGGLLLLMGAYDQRKKEGNHQILLAEGFIMSVIGILIMIFPLQTLRIFLILIGIWAFLLGILKIYIAIAMGSRLNYGNILIVTGVLLSTIGLLLLINPTWTAGHLLKVIGVAFTIIGVMMVYFSFSIRNARIQAPPE